MTSSTNTSQQQKPKLKIFSPLGIFGQNSQAEGSNAESLQNLYGAFQRTEDWQDNLHRKAAHKALNIRDEDMINAPQTTNVNGIGWKELIMVAALMAGSAGAAAYFTGPANTPPPAQPIQQPVQQPQPQPIQQPTTGQAELPAPVKFRVRLTPQDGGTYSIENANGNYGS